jgi:uncharacterized protein YdaU (DUF1376 family)
MPVYIGDYLADTMHLSTEQHGAYLLLLFSLWRRPTLPDDDATLAKICGLSDRAWLATRKVMTEFFVIQDGCWTHKRVDKERVRLAALQAANLARGQKAAARRWGTDASAQALLEESKSPSQLQSASDASRTAQALLDEYKSQSQSQSELKAASSPLKKSVDPRHTPFRSILAAYWQTKNLASPEMPWQGRDAKALSDFLSASPHLTATQFSQMLGNRARSAVAHGDRVYLWIGNLTRFQEAMTMYNRPVSAGGGNASRAEINRDSVISAVDRAITLAREHTDGPGQAGAEPAGVFDAGMPVADGAGPQRRALGIPGDGDPTMAAGHPAHGQTGADGPLPYCAPTTAAGGPAALRRVGER